MQAALLCRLALGTKTPTILLNAYPPNFVTGVVSGSLSKGSNIVSSYSTACSSRSYPACLLGSPASLSLVSTRLSSFVHLRRHNVPGKMFLRSYRKGSHEFCGPLTLERYRRRDGMPKSYELIYRSSFPNYLLGGQIFVFLSVGAVITSVVLWLALAQQSREERQATLTRMKGELQEKREQRNLESDIIRTMEAMKAERGWKGAQDAPATPQAEDLLDADDPYVFGIMAFSLISLAVALFRLQTTLPVRIYCNAKNHCVAIFYGHLLPGRLTHREFLAGTVTRVKKRFHFMIADNWYRDGTGRQMIMLEHFFRTPSDYNKVMGHEEFMDEVLKEKYRDLRRTGGIKKEDEK